MQVTIFPGVNSLSNLPGKFPMKLPRSLSFQNSWTVRKASRPGRAQLVHVLGLWMKVWRSAVFSWWKCGWRWWYFEDDLFFQRFTPPKFNMEPENDGFPSSESPNFQGLLFRWTMLNFRCVTVGFFWGDLFFKRHLPLVMMIQLVWLAKDVQRMNGGGVLTETHHI